MSKLADRLDAGDGNPSSATPHVLGIPRPPSVGGISSRVTDVVSEDGEHSPSSSSPPPFVQPRFSISRRGPPPTRSSVAASSQVTSRPGSSGSRLSRSHIPSLTAQAFFRPMSSQRLQAHRGGRPMTKGTVSSVDDGVDQTSQNRRSLVSISTLPPGSHPPMDMEAPPSRGTEFTDPIISERNTSNASPTGNTTVRSLGESVTLLQDRDGKGWPHADHLKIGRNLDVQPTQDVPERSSLSFLALQNNQSGQPTNDTQGHERLSSAGTSPGNIDIEKQRSPKFDLGHNYEYFTGNTLFCGGGRFQNSRDKPINIFTGILVVLPSALFFGFSYGTFSSSQPKYNWSLTDDLGLPGYGTTSPLLYRFCLHTSSISVSRHLFMPPLWILV